MIVLIDNYDSFTYNLYQLLGQFDESIKVIRNDALTVDDVAALKADHIVISPGPGRPAEAGICEDVVTNLAGTVPILGICLGHQTICEAYGGTITYARELMHGKQSFIHVDPSDPLFQRVSDVTDVGRYHSLAVDERTLPPELKVLARTDEGDIMAVRHVAYPVYGLQFHPESILTPEGPIMIENFLSITV